MMCTVFEFIRLETQFRKSYVAIGHQYVSENVIKIWGDFEAIFWKKPWAIALGIFQNFDIFLKRS